MRRSFYQTSSWRRLARLAKVRDRWQCQVCGDREDDPYCQLHAHHTVPRARGGRDELPNLITLCDLCHAVVTPRWHKPWFRDALVESPEQVQATAQEFESFLRIPGPERVILQERLWRSIGRLAA